MILLRDLFSVSKEINGVNANAFDAILVILMKNRLKMNRIIRGLVILFFLGGSYGAYAQCDASFTTFQSLGGSFRFMDSSGKWSYDLEKWDFGNGDSSEILRGSAGYKYSRTGTYKVCRMVEDTVNNCRDTFCRMVTWTGSSGTNCPASFKFYAERDTLHFLSSSDTSLNHVWGFGDGTYSTEQNPVHKYNVWGVKTFTGCLKTYDSTGRCEDSYCQSFVVTNWGNPDCNARFTYQQNDKTLSFNPVTKGKSNITYSWHFGEGTGSSAESPVKTYSSVKETTTYQVCLALEDTSTGCRDSFCDQVVIYSDSCRANFRYVSNGGLSVVFTSLNNGSSLTQRAWDFGDGDTTTGGVVTHVFKKPGTYVVCHSIADPVKKCNAYFCDTIKVDTSTGAGCKAGFDFTVVDKTVYLKNTSTGTTRYSWGFGDGANSSVQDPSHTYTASGTYQICLLASSTTCADTICKNVVIDSTKSCMAYYRVAVDTNQKFRVYLLNGSSNKSTHTYYWDFGDGSSSTKRNPKHQFGKFGQYNICLTIVDSSVSCVDKFCDTLGMDSLGRVYKAEGFELIVIDEFISVPTVEKVGYKLYPNPTNDIVTVELQRAGNGARVDVRSFDGRIIETEKVGVEGVVRLDLSGQVDGLYIIEIFDGLNYAQTKLIKMSR